MLSVAVVAIVDDVFFGFLLALLVESVGIKTFQFSGTGDSVPCKKSVRTYTYTHI